MWVAISVWWFGVPRSLLSSGPVQRMYKRRLKKERALNHYTFTWLSLANCGGGSIWAQQSPLHPYHWLLLVLPRSNQTLFDHISRHYHCYKINICSSRNPGSGQKQQQTTILCWRIRQIASCYVFQHIISSPRYPQSNGQVKRMVQMVNKMIQKSDDPNLAIMSYRECPHPWCNLSPAELLMGRRMRTTIPQAKDLLSPNWSYLPEFRQKNKNLKETQKKINQRHRVSE